MRHIIELKAAGQSISGIAKTLNVSRNTVKKYLRDPGLPQPRRRQPRGSKLAPFIEFLTGRIELGVLNAVVLFRELQERGYDGQYTVVKDFVRPFRRTHVSAQRLTTRFETQPGEQAQVDFGRYSYRNLEGQTCSIWAFVMVLGWSRALYVEFIRKADTASFIRCHVNAFAYFGGITQTILYDNTKQVVLERDQTGAPVWNPQFLDFSLRLGFAIRLCRPYRPRTKGKVERGVGYVEKNFWLGAQFVDDADLNRQARSWLDHIANSRVHGTTRDRPVDRLHQEQPALTPIPPVDTIAVFLREPRKVSWDSFVSYAGNFYGVPWSYAGQGVDVQADQVTVQIFSGGCRIAVHPRSAQRGARFVVDRQYDGLPAGGAAARRGPHLAYQQEALSDVQVEQRPLAEYAALVAIQDSVTLDEVLADVFREGSA
ncbi:IS21 family transposase [Deinococcus sp.]|uniref:IS21 family transposase n=1 Tax=Deinococcus sp. TaxID=47478 RepID=UPI0025BFF3FC|nr:IS21 family transposase [Deinococcus sp.]